MVYFLLVIIILLLTLVFWQLSLLFAALTGAPTVYADDQAIIDACEFTELQKGQLLIDLGCGNAKSLILAAQKFGARGIGVELSPFCYLNSKINVARHHQSNNIKIIFGDFKKAEQYLEQCDVVYLYLLNSVLKKIEPWLFAHVGPQTKIVSLAFEFEQNKPQKSRLTHNLHRETKIRLYSK